MAKEKPVETDKKKDKAERKAKKEKRADKDGVHKKKSKKDKHSKRDAAELLAASVDAANLQDGNPASALTSSMTSSHSAAMQANAAVTDGSLTGFSYPLATSDQTEIILRAINAAADNQSIKRGVKEVQKAIKNIMKEARPPVLRTVDDIEHICVIGADIAPNDIISHIPMYCKAAKVAYIFIHSRSALGLAGNTKRSTSVVLLSQQRPAKKIQADAEPQAEAQLARPANMPGYTGIFVAAAKVALEASYNNNMPR